jgi:hypothetical protein
MIRLPIVYLLISIILNMISNLEISIINSIFRKWMRSTRRAKSLRLNDCSYHVDPYFSCNLYFNHNSVPITFTWLIIVFKLKTYDEIIKQLDHYSLIKLMVHPYLETIRHPIITLAICANDGLLVRSDYQNRNLVIRKA